MDLTGVSVGPQVKAEPTKVPVDQNIQSTSGFAGVRNAVSTQTVNAVAQSTQMSDVVPRSRGSLSVDETTRRVVYTRLNPRTGEVERIPSSAELRAAAALKQQLDEMAEAAKSIKNLPVTGDLLDTKA
jgi:streptogramin lyase